MKTPNLIITIAQLILFIYLVVIQLIHNGWNKTEKILFWAGLLVAVVNSIVVFYLRRRGSQENKH